jgi:hypothetical protein
MNNYLQSYAEMMAQSQRRLEAAKPTLIAALKNLGVTEVDVEYDGEGDNGQVTDAHAYGKDFQKIDLAKPHPISIGEGEAVEHYESLEDCIEAFAWDVIGQHHDGFENNDGGYGTLTINVEAATITLQHSTRFVDSTTTETEF